MRLAVGLVGEGYARSRDETEKEIEGDAGGLLPKPTLFFFGLAETAPQCTVLGSMYNGFL